MKGKVYCCTFLFYPMLSFTAELQPPGPSLFSSGGFPVMAAPGLFIPENLSVFSSLRFGFGNFFNRYQFQFSELHLGTFCLNRYLTFGG